MALLLTLIDFIGICFALWLVKKLIDRRRLGLSPPGPKPFPLIGNVLDMPTHNPWETYFEWSQRYGALTHLNLLGQHLVIINSHEVAVDLLEKRGALYSDRPNLPSADITGYPNTLPLVPYGDRLREQRRMLSRTMGTRTLVEKYDPLAEREARYLLLSLLRDPSSGDHLREHVKKFTGALVLVLSYGYRINREGEDRLLSEAFESVERFAQASMPGAFLVDVLPILRYVPSWFPGAGWKQRLHSNRELMMSVMDNGLAFTKHQMAKGIAIPNFLSRSLEGSKVPEKTEEIAKWTGLALLGGGIDTTMSTLYAFFLAMTLYPEVQRKAQAELDTVVGQDRLPDSQDRDSLPYINAICLELLRWLPVGPLGIPRRVAQDDEYNGYFFQKGTIFITNIWGMLHDPNRYSNPFDFCPERYMKTSEKEAEPDPHEIVFGYGRRSCPGSHVADASIFIAVTNILATFTVEKKVENGVPVIPAAAQSSGMISQPLPFKCSIKLRSINAEQLISAAIECQDNEPILV